MSGKRKSGMVIFFGGVVLPLLLLGLVVVNLVRGEVYWPGKWNRVDQTSVYTNTNAIYCVIMIKIGLAWFTVAWNLLANLPRFDRYAQVNVVVGWLLMGAGMIGLFYGFFPE